MQALRLGHRGYVLEGGRIIASGSCDTLLRDEALRDAYLGRQTSGVAAKETPGEH
jgi:ABC-type branched-subunit amino acid transport system ATPase component